MKPSSSSSSPSVGVAYSGGGVTGLLAAMCAHEALLALLPSALTGNATTFSTASGGTLGLLVHQSTRAARNHARPVEYPPALSANLTLEQMSSSKVPPGHSWWAAASRYIPNVTTTAARRPAALGGAKDGIWWQDVLATLLWLGYGVREDAATMDGLAVGINVAVLRAASCPIRRNATSGTMLGAAAALQHGVVETSRGGAALRVHVGGGLRLRDAANVSLLQAGAWSSAFWAALSVRITNSS